MRKVVCVLSAGVLLLAGCGGGESAAPATTTVTTVTETASGTAPGTAPPAAAAPAEEPPAPQGEWAMPNLVGVTLQDAQDQIQALTADAVFFTKSHDLGGGNRNQVLDANWEVCTQNVPAGAAITASSAIDFGVVKLGEGCP